MHTCVSIKIINQPIESSIWVSPYYKYVSAQEKDHNKNKLQVKVFVDIVCSKMQVQKLFAAANKTFRICILKNLCILRPTVANYSTNIDSIPDRISPAERGAFRKQEIDNERAHDHSEPAYENALPFHRIPGPGGPPYFGTYFHYRKGMWTEHKLN